MPRPPKEPDDRRTGWIAFRASHSEIIRIHGKASLLDLSLSAFARQRALSEFVLPRRRSTDPQAVATLIGLANNMNQIARHANAGRDLPHDRIIRDLISKIHTELDRLHDPFDQHGRPDL